MAFSGKRRKTWSPNIQLQDSSNADHDSADEEDASQYRVLWSSLMDKGKYVASTRYHKAEVLLLCWDEKDSATMKEVDDLKTVFEVKFGYHTTIAKLSRETLEPEGPKLQVHVNFEVARFVKEHNEPNNLLIIYYAGHDKPGTRYGDLKLLEFVSSPNDPRSNNQRQLIRVIWNQTEELLKSAEADILKIFDCCYAEMVGQTKENTRLFEFLAATKANATTSVPEKESFTSALIYALGELVDQNPESRFTTSQLLDKINKHEHFPKDQVPLLIERGDSHKKAGNIMLHPIQRDRTESRITNQGFAIDPTKKHTVTLNFDFSSRPTIRQVETLGHAMNDMFKRNILEKLPPRWVEMRASITARAISKFRSSLHRRRSSQAEERSIVKEQSPNSQLAPSLLTPPYHNQDFTDTTSYAASGSTESSESMKELPRNKSKKRKTTKNEDDM